MSATDAHCLDVSQEYGIRQRGASQSPRPSIKSLGTVVGYLVLLVLVLAIHGFYPGESQPILQPILDAGAIQCLHNEGWSALTAHCTTVGEPTGITFLTGMPEIMLGWILSWIPGVNAWDAHQLLNAILDAAALASGYLLLRRWNVVRGIALVAPATYLVSPSVLGLNGFEYTFTGYTLLPLYVLLFLRSLDCFGAPDRRLEGSACLTLDCFLMVFTDGYSYATALLLVAVLGTWWLWRNTDAGRSGKLAATLTFALANVAGVFAYTLYINASAFPTVGLGVYRFLGLDPITLITPQGSLFWPSHVGYTTPTLHLWGDGSNVTHNYMGFVIIGLVGWLVVTRRLGRQPNGRVLELAPLLVGAALALFLSLGPALKLDSHATPTLFPPSNLPVSKTVIGLPTAFLYANVAPFDAMRATFRWSLGLRFVLIFAAAVALSVIWCSGKRTIAAVLTLLAMVEVAPAPGHVMRAARHASQALSSVRSNVFTEFDRLTTAGERVLMLPSASNDFLANALAPFAHVSTYNVGVDKSYAVSRAAWPADVAAAVAGALNASGQGNRLAAVLHQDATTVMICYFDLLQGARGFARANKHAARLKAEVATLAVDPRFVVTSGTWMASVRLRG